jgi:hypothetical protein
MKVDEWAPAREESHAPSLYLDKINIERKIRKYSRS